MHKPSPEQLRQALCLQAEGLPLTADQRLWLREYDEQPPAPKPPRVGEKMASEVLSANLRALDRRHRRGEITVQQLEYQQGELIWTFATRR